MEKWLEEYMKSASRLVTECVTLENITGSFASQALLPDSITESVLDHDFTLLAMKRYGEGAKDFWTNTLAVIKKLVPLFIEPVKAFLHNDVRSFKV